MAKTVARIGLDAVLSRQWRRLQEGRVLDVGAEHSPYRELIPAHTYVRLDIDPSGDPDICGDLLDPSWQGDHRCSFDTIVATEVLEHVSDPKQAVQSIYAMLKQGGVCVLSTRFMYEYHPYPKDFYRFTWDSLEDCFRSFSSVEIYHHGNGLQLIWHILTRVRAVGEILKVLNPVIAKIRFSHTNFPLGFVVFARK